MDPIDFQHADQHSRKEETGLNQTFLITVVKHAHVNLNLSKISGAARSS